MAIKGKKKHKSTKKARSAAPKREIVVPKTPMLSRRWVQNAALALVVAVIAAGLGYGFGKQSADTEAAATSKAAQASAKKANASLQAALKGTGILGDRTYEPFPDLVPTIEAPTAKAAQTARQIQEAADAAFRRLGSLDQADGAGLTDGQQRQLQAAIVYLGSSMNLFSQAGRLLSEALDLDGDAQRVALAEAKALATSASQVSTLAYTSVVSLLDETGAVDPEAQLPPGLTENLPPGAQPIAPSGGNTGIPQAP